MANTTVVYARIDTTLKENAENILSQLGITPSCAIQMLYSQIVINRGLPLELKLPYEKPLSLDNLSKKELEDELEKGLKSLEEGRTYTAEEVNEILRKKFNI